MIDLIPAEHESLARLVRAGADGLLLRDITVSHAIRLGLMGLATIQRGGKPQRVFVTAQGRAFSQRSAFA